MRNYLIIIIGLLHLDIYFSYKYIEHFTVQSMPNATKSLNIH